MSSIVTLNEIWNFTEEKLDSEYINYYNEKLEGDIIDKYTAIFQLYAHYNRINIDNKINDIILSGKFIQMVKTAKEIFKDNNRIINIFNYIFNELLVIDCISYLADDVKIKSNNNLLPQKIDNITNVDSNNINSEYNFSNIKLDIKKNKIIAPTYQEPYQDSYYNPNLNK